MTTNNSVSKQGTNGRCDGCNAFTFLLPLHGARGGPLRCPLCIGAWHAEHSKRRRHGRIVIRAIRAYLDNGGRIDDIGKLKQSAICSDFLGGALLGLEVGDPLGYLADVANTKDETIELTSKLLADAIRLTHPDNHPLERQDLARRTTQGLLALQPFTFPAPKPKSIAPPPPRDGSVKVADAALKEPSRHTYPCKDCKSTIPHYYCDACKAEWEKRKEQERQREAAKQRKWYADRKARRERWKQPTVCQSCGDKFKGKRHDARFCSNACRQKAHRHRPVTDKTRLAVGTLNKRDRIERGILVLLDRYPAVFQNDLLPENRTRAQYQALGLAAARLEAAGKISSFSYWARFGKPGFKVLTRPGYEPNDPEQIPRLQSNERLQFAFVQELS